MKDASKSAVQLETWLALGAVPLILFGLLGLWYRNTRALGDDTRWVEHTLGVRSELSDLFSSLLDLEAAARGLLLSGKEPYGARFETASAQVPPHFERLGQLVSDNPEQVQRLSQLSALVQGRLEYDQGLVAAARQQGLEKARVLFEVGDPKKQLLAIRALLLEMEQAEEKLYVARSAFARQSNQRGLGLGAALAFFLLLAMALYYALMRAQMARRQRAIEELGRTNLFLDTLVEKIPHMVFVKEAATLAFTRMNRAGEELLGLRREELLGKTDRDFFPEAEARFFQDKDRAALAGGAEIDIPEEPIETKKGLRWLHTKKVPLLADDGTPLFLLGISEDITERKQAADEIRRAKETAEATSAELEAFSYSISHDLRAPLRSIDGFSQALLQDHASKLDETGRDYFRRVRAAAQRMGELIDDLLDLSRVSRGELRHELVDLTRLAGQVGAELAAAQPERQIALSIAPGLQIVGDERLLRVMLENLLGNAWKFTSKTPQPRVELGAQDGQTFFLRDNGAGFDMAYAQKLFGPFQRLHPASEFEGTGIGLATVQRIVRRHGGRIWAKGVPGEGATFFFTLPAQR